MHPKGINAEHVLDPRPDGRLGPVRLLLCFGELRLDLLVVFELPELLRDLVVAYRREPAPELRDEGVRMRFIGRRDRVVVATKWHTDGKTPAKAGSK